MQRAKPRSDRAGTDHTRDTWECRYFVDKPPSRFAHEKLKKAFSGADGPHLEEDIYLIGSDIATNIKVRKRTGSIKLKVMLDRKEDGLERWRTELNPELKLPAPAEEWPSLLDRLKIKGDIQLLSRCKDFDQVVKALCSTDSNLTCVKTSKSRIFYEGSSARIEVAKVTIGTIGLHSVGFESPNLARARAIRDQFLADDLGTPINYMTMCLRIIQEQR